MKITYNHECWEIECDKVAVFGYDEINLSCESHKLDDMEFTFGECDFEYVRIFDMHKKNRVCVYKPCTKQASWNFANDTKRLFCKTHKLDTMVDVAHLKCICNNRPTFARHGETRPTHCLTCKDYDMVDVANPKCIICDKHQPTYAISATSKRTHCANCKLPDMVDVFHKNRCTCGKSQPIYAYPGESRATHCLNCKLPTMEDVVSPRCVTGCGTRIHGKYREYCVRCFVYTFPDEPVSRNYRIKERHFTDFVKEKFPELHITYDRQIQHGCSLKRPDVFIDCGTHVVLSECDENGHKYNSCETKRTMELFVDAGSLRMVMLRLNPDGYINKQNKKIPSCFRICKQTGILLIADKKKWAARLNVFYQRLSFHVHNTPEREFTVEYLFYDGYEST